MGVWCKSGYFAANMFGQYPVANVNLPKPNADYSAQWLISLLEQAAFQQKQQGGVVHINVPLPSHFMMQLMRE